MEQKPKFMTVAEVVAALQKLPQDAVVIAAEQFDAAAVQSLELVPHSSQAYGTIALLWGHEDKLPGADSSEGPDLVLVA